MKNKLKELEKQFYEACVELDKQCLRIGVNASYFRQMLIKYGASNTVNMLIHNPGIQYGFTILWERKRLDLTVEALILKSPWDKLFSDEEKAIARQRLRDHGYNPD